MTFLSEHIFMWEQNKPLTSFKTYLKERKENPMSEIYFILQEKKISVKIYISSVLNLQLFPSLQVKGTEYEVIDHFSFNCWDEHSI